MREKYDDLIGLTAEAIKEISNHKSGRPDCYLAVYTLSKIFNHYAEADILRNSDSFPYSRLDSVIQKHLQEKQDKDNSKKNGNGAKRNGNETKQDGDSINQQGEVYTQQNEKNAKLNSNYAKQNGNAYQSLTAGLKQFSRQLADVQAATPEQCNNLINLCIDLEQALRGRTFREIGYPGRMIGRSY